MMKKEKLIALVQAAQRQEDGALAALYEAFFDDTYYFINKTVQDPDLAADLAQDTFIDVFEKIDQLQEPVAFVSWIRQIAYHRCTGYFRKRKDILLDESEEEGSLFDTLQEEREEFIPDAALDQEDFKKTILSIVNQLPEEQRAAVVLRYYEEIPVAEIAKLQAVSEGTVKSRLNYGRKAIKSAVEEYEKKNGVKLHSVAIIPMLLWLFRSSKLSTGKSITSTLAHGKNFAVAQAAATKSSAVVKTTAATGAKAAVAKGAFFTGVKMKVIAAVTAVAVTAGGVGMAIAFRDKDEGKEKHSDKASETINGLKVDKDGLVTVYLITSINKNPYNLYPAEHQEITYDENGFPVECYMYSEHGENLYATNTYTIENGKIRAITCESLTDDGISTTTFDEHNRPIAFNYCGNETTYTYDNQGRLIELFTRHGDGSVYEHLYYTFDGNATMIDRYYSDDQEWDEHTIEWFNEDGKITAYERYDINNGVVEDEPVMSGTYEEGDLYYPEEIDVVIHKDHASTEEYTNYDEKGRPGESYYTTYVPFRVPAEYVKDVLAIQAEILQEDSRFYEIWSIEIESRPNHPARIVYW